MPKYVDWDSLDAKIEECLNSADYGFDNDLLNQVIDILSDPPAADVELKREIVPWKVAGAFDDFHQCTKCGNMWPIFSTVEWAHCPVCGCRKYPEPLKEEENAEQ